MNLEWEHRQKITNALTFIRENIGNSLTSEIVGKAVAVSPFHFQRLFKAYTKETLGQYITRKRLEYAAAALLYGQKESITDIAFRYGYASTASFSKAFVQWFGYRPSEMVSLDGVERNAAGRLQAVHEKVPVERELFVVEDQDVLPDVSLESLLRNVEIRSCDEIPLYALTSEGGYHFDAVEATWQALREMMEDVGLEWEGLDRFAICHDHPGLMPRQRCRYDACVRMKGDVPEGLPLQRVSLPAGRYAVLPCMGPPEKVLPQYIAFYSLWLPQSPYIPDDFPVVDHYLCPSDDGPIIELWAKIKRPI